MAVLADGTAHPPVQVKQGGITLSAKYSVVHAGLPYSSEIETVNFEPQIREGVSLGKKKRIARVAIKFQDSRGVDVGINGSTIPAKWRPNEPYGDPPRLRSGTGLYAVPGYWDAESSVTIRSEAPTPFTVLTVVPEVSLDG